MKRALLLSAYSIAISATTSFAQPPHSTHNHSMPGMTKARESTQAGPHGGSLKQTGNLQIETIISQGGLRMFVYDRDGKSVSVDQGRGAVSVRIEGNAKRYRYDLLPDGKGALTAPVNLSQLAGRQIDVEVQLVGMNVSSGDVISFNEVATVPASEQQRAAAAIARQKICPVSGKTLGSMGDPMAVDVDGQTLYVCCAGCVDAIKSDPSSYAAGRPHITVTTATQADATAITAQKTCPVMDEPLGGMGTPIKVMVGNKPIYLCCKGCIKKVQAEPAKYLAMVYGNGDQASVPAGTEQVREGIFKVVAADAPFIAAQKKCPVMDEPLDAMGGPYKVNAAGKAIYICCPGCAKKIAAEPQKWLAVLKSQGVEAPVIR
ncbi:eL24 family ribosomal protein [Novipirellula artificiosorum]|uniref:Archaeal TRASH domain protein n=1 Tax=Novipirellula artificiosorum TaxID=2528016 RepID=A0A5C6E0Z7_9BACT|nr:hypothetical protein [Novipirellula artificiosorum]TWU42578.1 Archaeal TRASH domain protein [Novipirellula artificiosorum]